MMTGSRSSSAQTVIGILCILPFFVGFIFLSYFKGATMETAFVFAIMGLFALIAAIMAYQAGVRPFKWWDGKLNSGDAKYLAMAYAGLLAIVYTITFTFGHTAIPILIALGGGGAILYYSLLKSESIVIPWVAHAVYNFSALALAGASVIPLSASPIYVPNFSFADGRPADLGTQFILQFAFVAFAEEMVKVAAALGAYIFVKDKRIAIIVAIIAWVALHSVLAYRVTLPS